MWYSTPLTLSGYLAELRLRLEAFDSLESVPSHVRKVLDECLAGRGLEFAYVDAGSAVAAGERLLKIRLAGSLETALAALRDYSNLGISSRIWPSLSATYRQRDAVRYPSNPTSPHRAAVRIRGTLRIRASCVRVRSTSVRVRSTSSSPLRQRKSLNLLRQSLDLALQAATAFPLATVVRALPGG